MDAKTKLKLRTAGPQGLLNLREFINERIVEIHHSLENASDPMMFHTLQGRIHELRGFLAVIDNLDQIEEQYKRERYDYGPDSEAFHPG